VKSKKGRSSYHTGTTPVSHYDPNQFDSSKWLITIYHIQRNYLPGQTEFIYGCNNGASIKWTHWWLGGDSSGMTHPPINKKKVEERGEVYESSTQLVYTVWSLEWITWTFSFQFPWNPRTEQWQITVRNFESITWCRTYTPTQFQLFTVQRLNFRPNQKRTN